MARPKKTEEVKEKKVVELVQTPGKIVNVVFTIPTNIPYESARVEISGMEDDNELVQRYNDLVQLFRPKPKQTPTKEPLSPYSVPRKVPASDDEAGGAVIKEEVLDDDTIALQKLDIVTLLEEKHGFMCKGKTKQEISDKVFEITSLALREDQYADIIDALKK